MCKMNIVQKKKVSRSLNEISCSLIEFKYMEEYMCGLFQNFLHIQLWQLWHLIKDIFWLLTWQ